MRKLYEFICYQKYFHKSIHISLFDKYFYRNKKSKLYFGDHDAVENDFLTSTEGVLITCLCGRVVATQHC